MAPTGCEPVGSEIGFSGPYRKEFDNQSSFVAKERKRRRRNSMNINRKHIGLGVGAAVIIAAVIVWFSGGFSAGKWHGAPGKSQPACTDHGCGDEDAEHGQEAQHEDE